MITIIPAVLSRDTTSFKERIRALEKCVPLAQLDVINNTLVAGETIADPSFVESLGTKISFEVHLMVDLLTYDLSQWRRPWVDRIIVHGESAGAHEAIRTIQGWGATAIIACNPDSHCEDFKTFVEVADGIMFMTIAPGAMGNAFRHDVVERIAAFHAQYPSVLIEVDGGVTPETLPQLVNAGATRFVVGSYLDNDHISERLEALRAVVGGA